MPPSAPTIADLPDDLLLHCLALLSQEDRFESAALVSKRWQRACLAPQLLQNLKVLTGARGIKRLSALLEFLVQHGPHVRSLELRRDEDGLEPTDAPTLVTACVAACGAVGSLERLTINTPDLAPPRLHALAGLAKLQQLKIGCRGPITLPACVSRLTALADLELIADRVECEGGQLPPGITRLRLQQGFEAERLPIQVLSLAQLSTLELYCDNLAADSLAPLALLPALRRLNWEWAPLPSSASTLTQLRELVVESIFDDEEAAPLEEVLPHLSRLTALALRYMNGREQLPASLASLPQLQRLCVDSEEQVTDGAVPTLPPGPWLAKLRWLGLPWPLLAASTEVLRGATQLGYLASLTVPEQEDSSRSVRPGSTAVWALLEALPALRCFAVEDCEMNNERGNVSALLRALFRLKDRRPALSWRLIDYAQSSFLRNMLELRDVPGS